MLPAALKGPLQEHLKRVKAQHDADVAAGRGSVALPGVLRVKFQSAPFDWAWRADGIRPTVHDSGYSERA